MAITATEPTQQTNWLIVSAATFAGIAIAVQMGKAAASLPLIRAEFGADTTLLATYVALISLVAAVFGVGFGSVTSRLGARRAGLIGLGLVAVGSALGAHVASVPVLLATRVIEALGFALTVTAMPALIQAATAPKDRHLALGIWATWLPAGVAVMMVASFFFLDQLGWRGLFWLSAVIPACAAVILAVATRRVVEKPLIASPLKLRQTLSRRDVMLTVGLFVMFSAANLIVLAFLPTILVDEFSMAPSRAAAISFCGAIALMSTNILAGILLQRGFGKRRMYLLTLTGMIVFAAVLLLSDFGQAARITAAILFNFCAGVPAAIVWASIPVLARTPQEVPILSGLIFQGAGIGQILGPLLAGWVVDSGGGWSMAFWVIAGLLSIGVLFSRAMPTPNAGGRKTPA